MALTDKEYDKLVAFYMKLKQAESMLVELLNQLQDAITNLRDLVLKKGEQ